MPMNGPRNQFLCGTGSPEIRTVESVGATSDARDRTVLSEGRCADDLFEHERPIDLFPQRQVLVLEPVLQALDFFEGILERGLRLALFGPSILVPTHSTRSPASFSNGGPIV